MPLSPAVVVDAAVAILDEFGLADLTMRRLGEALDVRAGALYHHVPNKQSLLAAVADRIVADVQPPAGGWRDGLTAWAHALRDALLAHRDSAEIVATARAMGLARLDAAAPAADVLRRHLDATAPAVATALLHFVLGHVAEEQARRDWQRFGKPDPTRPEPDAAADFTVGLDVLLDGIAARITR